MSPADGAPRHGSRADLRGAEANGSGYSAQVAAQMGEVSEQLAARLKDPAVAHSIAEIQEIATGFSATLHGMADGLGGITEWLRASGHAGPLSGHASVVQDRLSHVGRELTRLAEAIDEAERGDRAS